MKPYYEHGGISIFHGDYSDVIDELPAADCCVTDPPYGETSLTWDGRELDWLSPLAAKLSDRGSAWSFGSLRYLVALLHSPGMQKWRHAQEIVWEKHNGSSFHADRFKRVHELAVQLYKKDTPWEEVYKVPIFTNDATSRTLRRKRRPAHTGRIEDSSYQSIDGGPRLMTSVLFERNCHGYAAHPTQKPLGILRTLIEYSCPAGGMVLDPFMGSGSTLVAAAEQGRRAIGIELAEKYCEVAAKRLSQDIMRFGGGE